MRMALIALSMAELWTFWPPEALIPGWDSTLAEAARIVD
jgi:hypothetical protein